MQRLRKAFVSSWCGGTKKPSWLEGASKKGRRLETWTAVRQMRAKANGARRLVRIVILTLNVEAITADDQPQWTYFIRL